MRKEPKSKNISVENISVEEVEINGRKYVPAGSVAHSQQNAEEPLSVGNTVLIRAITYHYLGRIAAIDDKRVLLVDASWLADSGRFGASLETGSVSEVEPYPDPVSVSLGAIVDVTLWRHSLPREAK